MAVFRKRTHTPTPKKKDIPAGLWTKCPQSGEMVYTKDLEANWNVFPVSGYHERLSTKRRIALLIDDGSWKETDSKLYSRDPLKFTAGGSYPERLASTRRSLACATPSFAATASWTAYPFPSRSWTSRSWVRRWGPSPARR